MSTTGRWAPRVAMGALVGLILTAWLVARSETPQMTIRPDRAAPGHTVTVEFKDHRHSDDELTLEVGDQVFLLAGDQLTELDALPEPPSTVDAPSDQKTPSEPDLASRLGVAIQMASQDDQLLLPSGFADLDLPPGASWVVLTNDYPMPSSVLELTLPYELERGTYRACTLPDEKHARVCAPLTVGFGD